jgi:hypothetical protein
VEPNLGKRKESDAVEEGSMSNAGWIKLHRAIIDNPRSSNPEWFSIWLHLLLLATHRPIKMVFGKDVIELKPGQLITSRNSLSKKTGVHRSTVDRILTTMKNEQQIEQVSSSVSRLITIVKWNEYQIVEPPSEPQASRERATGEPRASTNKNIKKKKNIRNIEVQPDGSLSQDEQEWLNGLIADAAYRGVNIPVEFRKCLNWCNANDRTLNRATFVNWINRAGKEAKNVVTMQQDWFRDVKDSNTNLEAYR